MSLSSSERSMIGRIAAEESWAKTGDRTARTAPARRALDQKFLDAADGDTVRAEHLRKAHFARLALKSAQSRRRSREASAYARAQFDARNAKIEADAALLREADAIADREGLDLEPGMRATMLQTFNEFEMADQELWAALVRAFLIRPQDIVNGGSHHKFFTGAHGPVTDVTGEVATRNALKTAMRDFLESSSTVAR